MVFKCEKGMYHLQSNYRDAFNLEKFIDKYIEECFDKYTYIVGDVSSDILRLKGFDTDPKSKNFYGNINDYLEKSCSLGCAYYVLKRIKSEGEYEHLQKQTKNKSNQPAGPNITPIVKENFDKESLVLKSSPKIRSRIVIDMARINSIPKGSLPKDVQDSIEAENKQSRRREFEPKQKEEPTTSYISASPDFDPSKVAGRRNFSNNNKKNNKSQNNANNTNKQNNKNHKKRNDSK